MRDRTTGAPLFTVLAVELACAACKAGGKPEECVHMLHLVPRWQSADRHVKLRTVMGDRPDLIQSELSGLAFDSLQQIFKSSLLNVMFNSPAATPPLNETIHVVIDPAAGGPSSDYAMLTITRIQGIITVSLTPPDTHPAPPPAGPR